MDCDGITMEAGDWLGGCRWGQWQWWQETTWWSKARLSHLKWFLRDNCTVITFRSNPETQQLLVRKKKKNVYAEIIVITGLLLFTPSLLSLDCPDNSCKWVICLAPLLLHYGMLEILRASATFCTPPTPRVADVHYQLITVRCQRWRDQRFLEMFHMLQIIWLLWHDLGIHLSFWRNIFTHSFAHLCINSVNRHLLNPCYVPHSMLSRSWRYWGKSQWGVARWRFCYDWPFIRHQHQPRFSGCGTRCTSL